MNAYRHNNVESQLLTHPDEQECKRFVQGFEQLTGHSIDQPRQFLEDLRQEPIGYDLPADDVRDAGAEYDLLVLIYWLTEYAEQNPADPESTPNKLTESVGRVYRVLSEANRPSLQLGMLVNTLNIAGVEIHPELLYAPAPDDAATIEKALDELETHMVLSREAAGTHNESHTYVMVQEAWSVEFLNTVIEKEGDRRAHRLFTKTISAVLELADEDTRQRVEQECPGTTPYLDRIETTSDTWCDLLLEQIFAVGREWPRLAPLFGPPGNSELSLPELCSTDMELQTLHWHGEMYYESDTYDRAAKAFELIAETAADSELEASVRDQWLARSYLGVGKVEWSQSDLDAATMHLKRALDNYREIGDRGGEGLSLKHLGIVSRLQGEYDRAETYQSESRAIAQDLGDIQHEAEVLNELGLIAWSRGDYETAAKHCEESLSKRRETGDRRGVASCLHNLAVFAFHSGKLERAKERHRRALVIHRSLGNRQGIGECLVGIGLVAHEQNRLNQAFEHLDQARELYETLEKSKEKANCLSNLGLVAESRSGLTAARSYYERAREIYNDIGDQAGVALCRRNLGEIAHRRAKLETATETLQDALELYRDIGDLSGEGEVLSQLAIVARKRGCIDTGINRANEALAAVREVGNALLEGEVLETVARLELRDYNPESAKRHLKESLKIRKDIGDEGGQAICHALLGRVSLVEEDLEAAARQFDRAVQLADEITDPRVVGDVRFHRAEFRRQKDEYQQARDEYERAVASYREVGIVYGEVQTLLQLVEVYQELGDHAKAKAKCNSGRRLAENRDLHKIRRLFESKRSRLPVD